MRPSFTSDNLFNRCAMQSHLLCEGSACANVSTNFIANFQDLGVGQFRQMNIFSFWAICYFRCGQSSSCATFLMPILRVFLCGSKKQVIRVDTPTVVTFVANVKTLWYRFTRCDFKRQPMSSDAFLAERSVSVSTRRNRSFPNPTRFSFLNLFPKSLLERTRTPCVITFWVTVLRSTRVNVAERYKEFCFAVSAYSRYVFQSHCVNLLNRFAFSVRPESLLA